MSICYKILIIKISHFNYNFDEAWCAFMLHCQTRFFNLLIFWINNSKFYEIHWFHVQNGDNFKVPWWVVMTLEFWWNHHTILLEKQASRYHLYFQFFHYFFYKEVYFKKSFSGHQIGDPTLLSKLSKGSHKTCWAIISFFFVTCTLNGILCAYNVLL
jgi:hypothetical protein